MPRPCQYEYTRDIPLDASAGNASGPGFQPGDILNQGRKSMDRRKFITSAAVGTMSIGLAQAAFAAEVTYPSAVDPKLFETINRIKDPANKTPVETTHAPAITAPASVKASEPFAVTVSVGEKPHGMKPEHWIEYIELRIGNEPAGRIDFQSKGYLVPKATFQVVLPPEVVKSGKVTLVATERCNLHGLWESSLDVNVG
jgi:superoxide reductase